MATLETATFLSLLTSGVSGFSDPSVELMAWVHSASLIACHIQFSRCLYKTADELAHAERRFFPVSSTVFQYKLIGAYQL